MIKYELFSINCIASNINWQAKTVSISHNIKYFMVSIEHYGFNDKLSYELNNELNNESTLNLPITYSDVSRHWFENINKYNKLYNIKFSDLKIGIDYSIAPIYISRNKIQDIIIIGIFLLNNYNIKYDTIKSNTTKTFRFLSNIKHDVSNKYKIFSGILNYQNEINDINDINETNEINIKNRKHNDKLNNKFIIVDICNNNVKYKIPIHNILFNACNYLPKIDITVIKNKFLQGIFKIS